MRNKFALLFVVVAAAMMGLATMASGAFANANVLVFTGGNSSPATATAALQAMATGEDFTITVSNQATSFTNANLSNYRAVVLLNNTGDPFNTAQQNALQSFVNGGGGLLTIGQGISIHQGNAGFNNLFGISSGSRATAVAGTPSYVIEGVDRVHAASRNLPILKNHSTSWLTYSENPTGTSHVLARVRTSALNRTDDSIRSGSSTRPISWCRDVQNGRSLYTGLGIGNSDWSDTVVLNHIKGSIWWVTGLVRSGCKATINANYQATRLSDAADGGLARSGESYSVDVAPNGWVVYVGRADCRTGAERGARLAPPVGTSGRITDFSNANVGVGCGTVHVLDPSQYTGTANAGITRSATLAVYGDRGDGNVYAGKIETGLKGIVLSPDFMQTGHVYLHYYPTFNPNTVPPGLSDGAARRISKIAKGRISRFTMNLNTKILDLSSEVKIFEWDSQVYNCCHRGGGMGFDSAGNLYITTGDNVDYQRLYGAVHQARKCPVNGTGNPENGNCGNSAANAISTEDARRTAGNTNDYNGKMLRIKPITTATTSTPIGIGSTYEIPGAGDPNGPNMFSGFEAQDGSPTGASFRGQYAKPEIYVMGLRNPSRLTIDPETDVPYVAYVGYDASAPSVTEGPAKLELAARVDRAANLGWPYCAGGGLERRGQAFRDYILSGGTDVARTSNSQGGNPNAYVSGGGGSGSAINGWYDCDNIRNDSENNTGVVVFPHSSGTGVDAGKVQTPNIWYGTQGGCPDYTRRPSGVPTYEAGADTDLCPYVSGGAQAAFSGPVYRFKEDATEFSKRWPSYWDGRWFMFDYQSRDNIRHALLLEDGDAGRGLPPAAVDSLKSITNWGSGSYIGSEFGPDGALYIQLYDGNFSIGNNAGIVRVAFTGGDDTPGPDPQAQATGPGVLSFSIGASGGVSYEWDFGDGDTSNSANPTHQYDENGQYEITLTVTYADGEEVSKTITRNVILEDSAPPTTSVALNPASPGAGGTYDVPVTVTLNANDDAGGSGVDETRYRINGGAWQVYSQPFVVYQPGEQLIEYYSIDLAGNPENSKSLGFSLETPDTSCTPDSDEFNGGAIDTAKWQILRDNPALRSMSGGQLGLTMTNSNYNAGTANVPNTLLQDTPNTPWTATVKMNHQNVNSFDRAAGMLLWASESPNYFAKVVAQWKASWDGQPVNAFWVERALTVNGAHSTNYGGPEWGSANEYPNSGGLAPKVNDLWLRITFDGTEYGSWYSLDGVAFQRNAPPFPKSELPGTVKVGFFANRSSGGTDAVVNFDYFRMQEGYNPSGPTTCAVEQTCAESDPFLGNELSGKWDVVNANRTNPVSIQDGHAVIPLIGGGDVFGNRALPQNTLLQPTPSGSWVATAKIDHTGIDASPVGKGAGLALINGLLPNYVAKSALQYKNAADSGTGVPGIWAERVLTVNNQQTILPGETVAWPNSGILSPPGGYIWVRLVHDADANLYTTWTSIDGESFIQYGQPIPGSSFTINNGVTRVGVFGKHDGTAGSVGGNLRVDEFNIVVGSADPQTSPDDCGEVNLPTTVATTNPAVPNGDNGWFKGPVTVSLTAEGGEHDVQYTQYRIDGGDWASYSTPVQVAGQGEHSFEFRSVDTDGNAEQIRHLELKIDSVKPTSTATFDPAASDLEGPITATFDAEDGTSGVAKTEYRVDGGAWTEYKPEVPLFDGTQATRNKWVMSGPGNFVVDPANQWMESNGGMGLLWYSEPFESYSLKMQWRDVSPGGTITNAGVFIRFPHPLDTVARAPGDRYPCQIGSAQTDPVWSAIYCGYEIQINDNSGGDTTKTGSVYTFSTTNFAEIGAKPKGEWSDYEIRVVGQQFTIIRDGNVLKTFDAGVDQAASRSPDPPSQHRRWDSGHIGLQNHGTNENTQFRDINLTPLDPVTGADLSRVNFVDEGQYLLEFRSVDEAGNVEDTKSQTVLIGEPPITDTTFVAAATPKSKKLAAKKKVNAKVKITNTGPVPATGVKVCAKVATKKAKIVGAKCVTLSSINSGASLTSTFKLMKKAKGKSVKVFFTITADNAPTKTASVKLILKKPKKK